MHRFLVRGVRNRGLSPSTVLALIALCIALGGTSYAALSLPANSVGTKQIKKKAVTLSRIAPAARTALRGRTGPPGAAGAAGPIGPAGPPGPAGPFPATLPAGKTLTGTFGLGGFGQAAMAGSQAYAAISFAYPLAAAPAVHVIAPAAAPPAGCSGTVASPGAASGNLCIFENVIETGGGGAPPVLVVVRPDTATPTQGASAFGAVLGLLSTSSSPLGFDAIGTWAVTG